jgi:hypothetical protein
MDLLIILVGLILHTWAVVGFFHDWGTPGERVIVVGVGLLLVTSTRKRTP